MFDLITPCRRGRCEQVLAAVGCGWLGGGPVAPRARCRREAVAQGVPMSVSDVIAKIVSFLRSGYPQGVPATDTFAL